ncbi:RNA polymerase sigma factor [Halovulum dunhuangense]|uniref:RNA polymerase sigma factor n=1 Tax=Halovulum dunhuangense TaxID=1505036 RepID=A0A849L5N2_9RHOB|nr:sigma-70 family RNA polymerase sigma factor [Halovulum dunhuangense]NNU81474.1 RNA polymerase sigma factor [Halovulum dunhuangense]
MGSKREDLLGEHRRGLYGYALSLSRDPDRAADLLQDCALRAMSTRHWPDKPTAVRAWLFTILRNLWIDDIRARTRRDRAEQDAAEDESGPPRDFPDGVIVTRIAVRQAFFRLAKDHRDVLALVDLGGFSYQDVADILGVPRGTVMSRISRARLALAELLAEGGVVDLEAERRRRAQRGAR